jgi:hypothetical protein
MWFLRLDDSKPILIDYILDLTFYCLVVFSFIILSQYLWFWVDAPWIYIPLSNWIAHKCSCYMSAQMWKMALALSIPRCCFFFFMLQDKLFQCVAQITAVNNPYSWFYDSCFNCHDRLQEDQANQLYWCTNCREWHDKPVLWYALLIVHNTYLFIWSPQYTQTHTYIYIVISCFR